MANTNVKQTRAPRAPRQLKASNPATVEPEEVKAEVENIVEEVPVAEPEVIVPEPETAPVQPEPEPEPKVKASEPETTPMDRTDIYLVQKGEKYNIYRGSKRLSRILVTLEKAKLIAAGYGENNPTVVK